VDNVKFLEEFSRMCKSFSDCNGCKLLTEGICLGSQSYDEFNPKKVIETVEEWSKENTEIKTMSFVEAVTLDNKKFKIKPIGLNRNYFFEPLFWLGCLSSEDDYTNEELCKLIDEKWEVKEI
jgi:hypothetical protein